MKKRLLMISVMLFCAMLVFSSCAAKEYGGSYITEDAMAENGYDAESPSEGTVSDELLDMNIQNTSAPADRKVIMTYDFFVETKDLDTAVSVLGKSVTEYGGYYESATVEGNTEDGGRATMVLRIPADKAEEFNLGLSALGNITSQTKNGEDVTTAYYDTENQLKSLKIQQERLLTLLEKAESLDDIILLENELTRVRTEIERLTTVLAKYDSLVNYSTVTVTLRQVKTYTEPAPETFGSRIAKSFRSSLKFTKELLQGLVILIVWLLPLIVFVGIAVTVIVLVAKSKKKKKAKAKLAVKDDETKE